MSPLMTSSSKQILWSGLLAAVSYLGCYAILSSCGGYVRTQSGQVRYDFGLSVTDIDQWQPRFAFCQRFRQIDGSWTIRSNFLGSAFAPLILLDQLFVHKTIRHFDPGTGRPIPNPQPE